MKKSALAAVVVLCFTVDAAATTGARSSSTLELRELLREHERRRQRQSCVWSPVKPPHPRGLPLTGRPLTHAEALDILTQDPAKVNDYLDMIDASGTINWRLGIDTGETCVPDTLAYCCAAGRLSVIPLPEDPLTGTVHNREDIDRTATEATRVAIMKWMLDRDPEAAWADYKFDRGLPYHNVIFAFTQEPRVLEAMLMHPSADKYIADGVAGERYDSWQPGQKKISLVKFEDRLPRHIRSCELLEEGAACKTARARRSGQIIQKLRSWRDRARRGSEQCMLEAVFRDRTDLPGELARHMVDGLLGQSTDYENFAARRLHIRAPWLSGSADRPLHIERPSAHEMTWASFAAIDESAGRPWDSTIERKEI